MPFFVKDDDLIENVDHLNKLDLRANFTQICFEPRCQI